MSLFPAKGLPELWGLAAWGVTCNVLPLWGQLRGGRGLQTLGTELWESWKLYITTNEQKSFKRELDKVLLVVMIEALNVDINN